MAIVKCRECGKDVSSDAVACPHCGKPSKPKSGSGCGTLVAGVFVLFAVAYCATQVGPGASPTPASSPAAQADGSSGQHAQAPAIDESYLRAAACVAAQGAVKEKLKAPSSAKFPGCALEAHRYELRATPDKRTIWVFSYVDSQNSYGAMLRSKFGVELRYDQSTKKMTPVRVELE